MEEIYKINQTALAISKNRLNSKLFKNRYEGAYKRIKVGDKLICALDYPTRNLHYIPDEIEVLEVKYISSTLDNVQVAFQRTDGKLRELKLLYFNPISKLIYPDE